MPLPQALMAILMGGGSLAGRRALMRVAPKVAKPGPWGGASTSVPQSVGRIGPAIGAARRVDQYTMNNPLGEDVLAPSEPTPNEQVANRFPFPRAPQTGAQSFDEAGFMPTPPPVEVVSPDQFNRIDAAAPPAPVTMPSSPGAGVDMPPRARPAPAAAPVGGGEQIPWFIRNGWMQRDPDTGAFLNPQLAKRAMGSFSG